MKICDADQTYSVNTNKIKMAKCIMWQDIIYFHCNRIQGNPVINLCSLLNVFKRVNAVMYQTRLMLLVEKKKPQSSPRSNA